MKVIVTLTDLLHFGTLAILIVIGVLAILVEMINRKIKDWRYMNFKCPNCEKRKNGSCNHFRDSGSDCEYFCKKNSGR